MYTATEFPPVHIGSSVFSSQKVELSLLLKNTLPIFSLFPHDSGLASQKDPPSLNSSPTYPGPLAHSGSHGDSSQ